MHNARSFAGIVGVFWNNCRIRRYVQITSTVIQSGRLHYKFFFLYFNCLQLLDITFYH